MSVHEKKIIVAGGGIAGAAAAIAAGKSGARAFLISNEGSIGGDACTGMPILGTYSARGEKCVGGVLDELVEICKSLPGGYIGPVCDFRTVYGLCVNPAAMRIAIFRLLKKYNVELLLNSTVCGVDNENGRVKSINAVTREGLTQRFECEYIVDATGRGNIVKMAGGNVFYGDESGNMQPVSMVFRMAGVNFEKFLNFIKENPGEALLAENSVMEKDKIKAAEMLYSKGYPYVALSSSGKVLGDAIRNSEIYPCTAMFMTPTSMETGEVCVNSTRIAKVDAACSEAASDAMKDLNAQIEIAIKFLTAKVPGFENAVLSGVANRLGVRETGRIEGRYTLTQNDVVSGRKHVDWIGMATHHVDIHGAGTAQVRIPVKNGGSYDIPFGCLLPPHLKNVIAAGRCISSDRGANGSVRVMGSCIVTGQAAGAASALAVADGQNDLCEIDIGKLRRCLVEQGVLFSNF